MSCAANYEKIFQDIENSHNIFATWFKMQIKSKGILQKDLALGLSVESPTISQWKSGKRFPEKIFVKCIGEYLQLSVNEMAEGMEAWDTTSRFKANMPLIKAYLEENNLEMLKYLLKGWV